MYILYVHTVQTMVTYGAYMRLWPTERHPKKKTKCTLHSYPGSTQNHAHFGPQSPHSEKLQRSLTMQTNYNANKKLQAINTMQTITM
jgi:hypothetical protein